MDRDNQQGKNFKNLKKNYKKISIPQKRFFVYRFVKPALTMWLLVPKTPITKNFERLKNFEKLSKIQKNVFLKITTFTKNC